MILDEFFSLSQYVIKSKTGQIFFDDKFEVSYLYRRDMWGISSTSNLLVSVQKIIDSSCHCTGCDIVQCTYQLHILFEFETMGKEGSQVES